MVFIGARDIDTSRRWLVEVWSFTCIRISKLTERLYHQKSFRMFWHSNMSTPE